MAYFLFVDESGQDRGESPYEVLAGVAIEDRKVWSWIQAIQACEVRNFGTRYTTVTRELKAKRLLKRKTFRLASQLPTIPVEERTELAGGCLTGGARASMRQLTALSQAKIAFVEEVLEICRRYRCRVFASVVDSSAPRPMGDVLRKDYSYLFERYFYFLKGCRPAGLGVVVFDELERVRSHVLVDQMGRYFRTTAVGKTRSERVIPEPFFVHSDLTTGIQVADICAYLLAWGFRFSSNKPKERAELRPLARRLRGLGGSDQKVERGKVFEVGWVAYINDLRPRSQKENSQKEKAM